MGRPGNRVRDVNRGGHIRPPEPVERIPAVRDHLRQVDPHRSAIPKTRAAAYIDDKWNESGGAFGAPLTPGEAGVIGAGDRYFREYATGSIYTDLSRGPDTFVVYGAIRERYRELNGPSGWLGWPTSDEQDFVEGGRVSTFEHGAIYWWSDTGPIDLGMVAVRYRGLYCFSETSWDQGSDSDEPKVLLGVVPAPPALATTFESQTYADVDGRESREDNVEIYRGLPYGLGLSVTLIEVDFGGAGAYLDKIQTVVQATGHTAAGIAAAFPPGGPIVAGVIEALLKAFGNDVAAAINDLMDLQDDNLGTQPLFLSGKEMVTLTRAPRANFHGIEWQRDSPLISRQGADYKAYFDVIGV